MFFTNLVDPHSPQLWESILTRAYLLTFSALRVLAEDELEA